MKLAIFGASGRTGHPLVEQALASGHEVKALLRTPSRLDLQHERLHVIQGDIQDAAKVAEVVAGTDAVLSVLGPANSQPTFTVSKGTANIIAAMQQHGVRRLVVSAGAGVRDPQDRPGLFDKGIGALIKLTSPNVYEDMVRTVNLVRVSDLDWTVVRAPMLTDAPAKGNVKIGYVGQGVGPRLSRGNLAAFVLSQANDTTYQRQAPVISN